MSGCDNLCQEILEFFGRLDTISEEDVVKKMLEIDGAVSSIEKQMALKNHNLSVSKNIYYNQINRTNSGTTTNGCASVFLRDSGALQIDFRRLRLFAKYFYKKVSELLISRNNSELAYRAEVLANRYESAEIERFDKNHVEVESVPGWYERPQLMEDGTLIAIDYPEGKPVYIHPESGALPIDTKVPTPIHDILRGEDGWYFISCEGTQIVETDKEFQVRDTTDLDLLPAHIARHCVRNNNLFACTQYDSKLHFHKRTSSAVSSIVIPGATELRLPAWGEEQLLFINFTRQHAGCSEILMLDEHDFVRGVSTGFDHPTSLCVFNGIVAVGDRLGIHFVGIKGGGIEKSLYYADLPLDMSRRPYCSGGVFDEQSFILFIMYLDDFIEPKELSQSIIRLKRRTD